MAGLAFVQVSLFFCSMTQLAWHYWLQYPYKLFTLLDDVVRHEVAQDFLDQPECMLDEFSRRFRRREVPSFRAAPAEPTPVGDDHYLGLMALLVVRLPALFTLKDVVSGVVRFARAHVAFVV